MIHNDNNSCHEMMALINDGSLDISSLDIDTLYKLFDYLCSSENYDEALYQKCLTAIDRIENFDKTYPSAEDMLDDALAECEKIYTDRDVADLLGEQSGISTKITKISAKRLIAIIAAAAILCAVFAMATYAVINPFSEFGIAIKEIFGMQTGESVKHESNELIKGDYAASYKSLEELYEATSIVPIVSDNQFKANKITLLSTVNFKRINITYVNSDDNSLTVNCEIYYDCINAPVSESDLISTADILIKYYQRYKFYIVAREDMVQATVFDSDTIYVFTTNEYDKLISFIENVGKE